MKQAETIKLLVFSIDQLNLALPIQQVKKIVNRSTVYNSGLSYVGVTNVDGQQITVVDLHYKLFNYRLPEPNQPYLIVSQNQAGEQFAIAIASSPSIFDVPLTQIRVLPESYRLSDTLGIASHVTVVAQEENSITIFILDLEKIIS